MENNKNTWVKRLSESTDKLLALLASLSEKQLNQKHSEETWSPAQIGDHLWKSYAVVQTLNGSVKKTLRQPGEKIAAIKKLFLNFDIKMESPTSILPSTEKIEKEKLLNKLQERILQLQNVFQTKDLSVTCTDFSIPEYGSFTRLEWLAFNTVHTERHIHQLKKLCKTN